MTNEIILTEKTGQELAITSGYKLPRGVWASIESLNPEEQEKYILAYPSQNPNPSYQEWVEGVTQTILFKHKNDSKERMGRIQKALDQHEIKLKKLEANPRTDPEELKTARKELKRLSNMAGTSQDHWNDTLDRLTRSVQKTLDREKPKTVNLNQNVLSVSDFQNMIQGIDEDKIVDAEFEEVDL